MVGEGRVTYDFALRLRARDHTTRSVLAWPLDTFFRALTISWSRLLARVRIGTYVATQVSYLSPTLGEYYIHKVCKEVEPVPPNLPTLFHVPKDILDYCINNSVDERERFFEFVRERESEAV